MLERRRWARRPPRRGPSPAGQRAARPRRHVRRLRHAARRRLGGHRRRVLPQRGLLDGVRPRNDRVGHVGAGIRVAWRSAPGARTASVTVDVPSGRLVCEARLDEVGAVEAVRFRNVPSFVLARDVTVRVARGPVTLDVGVRRRVLRLRGGRHARSRPRPRRPARSSSRCSASSGRRSNGPWMSCIRPRPTSPASTG